MSVLRGQFQFCKMERVPEMDGGDGCTVFFHNRVGRHAVSLSQHWGTSHQGPRHHCPPYTATYTRLERLSPLCR